MGKTNYKMFLFFSVKIVTPSASWTFLVLRTSVVIPLSSCVLTSPTNRFSTISTSISSPGNRSVYLTKHGGDSHRKSGYTCVFWHVKYDHLTRNV